MTGLRMVVYECGAFELCLPSLGILYQIYCLRTQLLGRTPLLARLGVSWGEDHRVYGSYDYAVRVGVMYFVRALIVWALADDDRTTMPACSPHPAPGPPAPGLIGLCVLARSVCLCTVYIGPLSRPLCCPSNGLLPLAIPRWPSI